MGGMARFNRIPTPCASFVAIHVPEHFRTQLPANAQECLHRPMAMLKKLPSLCTNGAQPAMPLVVETFNLRVATIVSHAPNILLACRLLRAKSNLGPSRAARDATPVARVIGSRYDRDDHTLAD